MKITYANLENLTYKREEIRYLILIERNDKNVFFLDENTFRKMGLFCSAEGFPRTRKSIKPIGRFMTKYPIPYERLKSFIENKDKAGFEEEVNKIIQEETNVIKKGKK